MSERLHEHERETDRDQALEDVSSRNAAGVGRSFTDGPRLHHVADRKPDHDQRDRHQQQRRYELDEIFVPLREARKQNIDAHVLAVAERIGHPEQADRRHQVPFQLLRPDRAGVEDIAQQNVAAHDGGEREGRPGGDPADGVDEGVDAVGQPFGGSHVNP
jgi:hypothetical protein